MNNILVISPHPDDETLGVGGTLLRLKTDGCKISWLIVTGVNTETGFSSKQIAKREAEIQAISKFYDFSQVFNLALPTTQLDNLPLGDIVSAIGKVFLEYQPDTVFLPSFSDAHSDHRIVFDACSACTKWFRYKSIKRVIAYETLSETGFNLNPSHGHFQPNFFVNITDYLDKKITAMRLYDSEMGEFPFPRSEQAMRAQAALHGATAGFQAAEAFQILKEIY